MFKKVFFVCLQTEKAFLTYSGFKTKNISSQNLVKSQNGHHKTNTQGLQRVFQHDLFVI